MRGQRLRQSNSESMIFPNYAKKAGASLDPRIYPSWWGDDHLESPAAPRAPSAQDKRGEKVQNKEVKREQVAPDRRAETSLERGIREIQATALNLDRNLQGIGSRAGAAAKVGDVPNQGGPKLNSFF